MRIRGSAVVAVGAALAAVAWNQHTSGHSIDAAAVGIAWVKVLAVPAIVAALYLGFRTRRRGRAADAEVMASFPWAQPAKGKGKRGRDHAARATSGRRRPGGA